MPNTHLSPTKSRRDLAASLRGSRSRKHARLRHRRLQAERLEDRRLLATISGAVFNDLNADGVKNTGESGQSGWTVYLDADGNGQLGTGETSTTTAADGSYSFDGLADGTYSVTEVLPLSWRQTSPVGITSPIERVSVAADDTQANNGSAYPSLSTDGRYVAFQSGATNLVPADTNGVNDIFVRDCQTGTTERVSVADGGTQGNGSSFLPVISADGRYVAFRSEASNLVPGDTNATYDVFVYDRQMHSIESVGLAADGTFEYASGNLSMSADGRYVTFVSGASNRVVGDTNGIDDIFVYDRQTQTTERVNLAADGTQSTGGVFSPSISADGRYVSFTSGASDLVSNDTNGYGDIFVRDRVTGTTERVSLASDGSQGNNNSYGTYSPSISADGRYVVFNSAATNLVPGDTNAWTDSFMYDRQTQTIERVNVAADGTQANGLASTVSISADGRYVALDSYAGTLVPGDFNQDLDAFVYDRETHTIKCVSVAPDGTQGNRLSRSTISADGRFVAISSAASNFVPGDTNDTTDIFVTTNPFSWTSGSHTVVVAESQDVSGINFGNTSPTKFYVVNDATQNLTYEYNASSNLVDSYSLNSGNTAPRGAASTIAGDKTWVVDANRKVYVYNSSGGLLGSWTAGTLSTKAKVEGIATNGTDIWIVDAYSDKVFKYTGAATRLSSSQNAASSFSLNSSNTNPKDIVTDGTSLWVVDDNIYDKVFKYTIAGSLAGSWTSYGGGSPTGITLDPANVSNLWIVDSASDRVYQYNAAASRTSGLQYPALSFALSAGNTDPQGLADPPALSSLLVAETPVLAKHVSAEVALRGNDAALASMYCEPLKKHRVDTVRRSTARAVESHTSDLSYTVGTSALAEPVAHRLAIDSVASDKHHSDVDDLFAQWESDPLALLSFQELGI